MIRIVAFLRVVAQKDWERSLPLNANSLFCANRWAAWGGASNPPSSKLSERGVIVISDMEEYRRRQNFNIEGNLIFRKCGMHEYCF